MTSVYYPKVDTMAAYNLFGEHRMLIGARGEESTRGRSFIALGSDSNASVEFPRRRNRTPVDGSKAGADATPNGGQYIREC